MTNSNKTILSKLGAQTNFCKTDAKSIICLLFFLPQWIWYIGKSVTVAQARTVPQAARHVQSSTGQTVVLGSLV